MQPPLLYLLLVGANLQPGGSSVIGMEPWQKKQNKWE
jgi:hypothetical protein